MIHNLTHDTINTENIKTILCQYYLDNDYIDTTVDDVDSVHTVDNLILDNLHVEISDDDSLCTLSSETISDQCNFDNIFENNISPISATPCIPIIPMYEGSYESPFECVHDDKEEYIKSLIYPEENTPQENNILHCNKRKKVDDTSKCNKYKTDTKRRKKNYSRTSEQNEFVLNHLYKYIPQDKYPRASLLRVFNWKRFSNIESLDSADAIDQEYTNWRKGEASQRRYLRCLKRKKREKD